MAQFDTHTRVSRGVSDSGEKEVGAIVARYINTSCPRKRNAKDQ